MYFMDMSKQQATIFVPFKTSNVNWLSCSDVPGISKWVVISIPMPVFHKEGGGGCPGIPPLFTASFPLQNSQRLILNVSYYDNKTTGQRSYRPTEKILYETLNAYQCWRMYQ